jgi:hypothetical protein
VLARNPTGALYEQAAGERQRLARAEIDRTMPRTVTRPAGPLPRRIRVVAIERERFAAGQDYDEMRQARVTLQPAEGEPRSGSRAGGGGGDLL